MKKIFLILFGILISSQFILAYTTPVGYDINEDVVEIWNKKATYYFNKTSGIQWTEHFQEYWSRNIFCIGYYSGGTWNKIKCADELTNFNRNIHSDNLTYVNATLWKDFSYNGYDLRMGIRYHIKPNDDALSIIVSIENRDTEDIPYELGFAWRVTDIAIDGDESDKIAINQTQYNLNENHDEVFENMYKYDDYSGYVYPTHYTLWEQTGQKYIRLEWDKNLVGRYKVKLHSEIDQSNSYVDLYINASLFSAGQEKSTIFKWKDPEGTHITNWSLSAGNSVPLGIATNGSYLWITDNEDNDIYVYDTDGNPITSWNLNAGNTDPVGVTTDNSWIWVSDFRGDKVYRYGMDGTYSAVFNLNSSNTRALGIGNNDTTLYVCDDTSGSPNRVYIYNKSGSYLDSWTYTGNDNPYGCTTDNSFLWITDRVDEEVYKYNMTGDFDSKWSLEASNVEPRGITTDQVFIWVLDDSNDRVYVYQGVLDITSPNVTINQPLNQTYDTNTLNYNVTALDDTGMSDCNYTLTSGLINYTMSNVSTSPTQWTATNSTMSEGGHNVIYHCWDTSNNLNNSESIAFSISIAPIPVGGGGGGTTFAQSLGIENISETLCNLTYDSLLTFGLDYSKIDSIQEEYETITNESITWTEVRTYMDNWQPLCSDLIERTLEPGFVCSRIYDFLIDSNYKPKIEEINNLTNELNKKIEISLELVVNYINNYDDKCYKLEYSPLIKKIKLSPIVTGGKISILWIFIVVVFITLIAFSYLTIKKKSL